MNNDPNEVVNENHLLIGTSVAAEPAAARSTNPAATMMRSTTAMCFSTVLYSEVSAT